MDLQLEGGIRAKVYVTIPVWIEGYAEDEYKAMTDQEVKQIIIDDDLIPWVDPGDWIIRESFRNP